ncbi:MAG: hypothetical protein JW839_11015 [Candidatus Lokiarchaeota archaeon]|nr:hypothetical protein [Candidatus Lokiarchaeota archaeon]
MMKAGIPRAQQVKELAILLEPVFERVACDFVYVAGSWSQGIEMPWSDLDIFIFKESNESMSAARVMRWLARVGVWMEEQSKIPNLDLQDLGTLPPHVQFSAISTGKLLFCKNPDVLYRFKERTMKLHYDLAPWRDTLITDSAKHMVVSDGRG